MECLVNVSKNFDTSCLLESHQFEDRYGKYHFIAAFGVNEEIIYSSNSFKLLKKEIQENSNWWFGHLAYDLKNEILGLRPEPCLKNHIPNLSFFSPKLLVLQKRTMDMFEIHVQESCQEALMTQIELIARIEEPIFEPSVFPLLQAEMSKEKYLKSFHRLKDEIQYGNVYEVNFCKEFKTKTVAFDPYTSYSIIRKKAASPFAAFYKFNETYLLGASPERYLCKRNQKIISQPIKGTIKRGGNSNEDEYLKENLRSDIKEQTENVMIVDLVRNDLSQTASKASVKVEELFGIYTFPHVHQMVSTVSSQLKASSDGIDAIEKSFPMGSMTGAPKIAAMKLIDELEEGNRGLYSGSLGYFDPDGDFDFNVCIRSLIYHSKQETLSLHVGGAITKRAMPEQEYQECLLKAQAFLDLGNSDSD